jgi:F0F1-type ATP synthase assembly protein I
VSSLRNSGRYGTVGLDLVFGLAIGFFLGRYLDQRFWGGHGYGTAGGSLFGVAAGVRSLMRASKSMNADIVREESEAFPFEQEYLEQAERADAKKKPHDS